ncbi:MAG TPA: glycosyltransferase family 39 protein, partial [Candidatus Acidoferrum sp.]|nr:glycosyltransferase family 39 protein [Candidatus Acidoferrum sp.]
MLRESASGQRGFQDRRSRQLFRVLAPACILAILLVYFWGLGSFPLLDPDEGMYAEISREMLARGDWIVPRFNGVVYVEKPPMMYWLTAATYAVAGPSEFSARFWKVASMLGTVVLTAGVGWRLFSSRVGALSGMILATTLGAFLFSRVTQMDPLFVCAITLAVFGIVSAGPPAKCRRGGRARRGGLWFCIGVGVASMSKGLLGIIFPLALLGLWIWLRRDIQVVRRGWSWPGVFLAALLTLPWHAAAWAKVPGFVRFYLVDNQLLRFLGNRAYVEDGKSMGTIAFLGITLFALFPWAPYLMAALTVVWRDVRHMTPTKLSSRSGVPLLSAGMSAAAEGSGWTPSDPRIHFLLGWLLMVLGLFSVSSFKLEYYALPAYPAVGLL